MLIITADANMTDAMEQYKKLEIIGYATEISPDAYVKGYIHRGLNAASQPVILLEVLLNKELDGLPLELLKEFSFLTEMQHRNILRLQDAVTTPDKEGICILFESMDLNLQNILSDPNASRPYSFLQVYLLQFLSAVASYHSNQTFHGNLKPENLWVNTETQLLKVSDLGLATGLGCSFETNPKKMTVLRYMAPEMLFDFKGGTAMDMWSVGCIFAEMLQWGPLFHGDTPSAVINSIFRLLGTPTEETWPGVSQMCGIQTFQHFEAKDLGEIFPTLDSVGIDLLSKMLCLDPRKRITAADALNHPYFILHPPLD